MARRSELASGRDAFWDGETGSPSQLAVGSEGVLGVDSQGEQRLRGSCCCRQRAVKWPTERKMEQAQRGEGCPDTSQLTGHRERALASRDCFGSW